MSDERTKHPIEGDPRFGWPFTDERFWVWVEVVEERRPIHAMAYVGPRDDTYRIVIREYIDHLRAEGREDEIPDPLRCDCGRSMSRPLCNMCDNDD